VAATVGDPEPAIPHPGRPGDTEDPRRTATGHCSSRRSPSEETSGGDVLSGGRGTFEAADLKLTGAVAAIARASSSASSRRRRAPGPRLNARRRCGGSWTELRIELDHERQAEQVEKVTETDYFGGLRAQASDLRRIIADRPG
jgi:hypothetical protein